jgi:hypothetical protein|tara:strand:- start:3568 stop:5454 length:1887 start_codon:yes stop_codon:yes gene_type:complete
MAERVWTASSAGAASTAGNWSGGSAPTSSDTVVFDDTSVENCTWDVTAVSTITVASTYTGVITVNSDIALTGLSCSRVGAFDASADRVFTFSGTAPYNSNKTFFQIGIAKDTSIFVNETARRLFYFAYTGSTTGIKYEAGEYPNIVINSGSHTPDYIESSLGTNTATAVKFYTLHMKGGSFAPASTTPTTADRSKEWISEGTTQNQFKVDSGVTTFDGGYATWTFQAFTGSFVLPTNGTSTYNGCRFTWQKWIIDSSVAGVGGKATIASGSSVFLNDLTVNVGAGVSGSNTLGGTFHLTNKPTIRGTWGFYPIADGIYVYKGLHTLNVADGGTGLQSVATGLLPFGSTSAALNTSTELSFANNTLHADKGIKLTEGADHPIAAAAGTGILWVKNTTPSTLIFTNDAGTDTTLGSGGGGGGGTVDVVSNVATSRILGRITGGSGDSEELTQAQVLTFLGNVEAGATADQTNAEIRTAVEAASDSNVFTDADHSKLNGIATSATAYADSDAISAVEGEATLQLTGVVRIRAMIEVCTSDPAPATTESGTIYQFTKGSAGVFTLPANPPVGTQFVLVNGDGEDIVITRPHSSVKINGATADKTNTTAYAATSIVAVVQNGNSSEWLAFGGI